MGFTKVSTPSTFFAGHCSGDRSWWFQSSHYRSILSDPYYGYQVRSLTVTKVNVSPSSPSTELPQESLFLTAPFLNCVLKNYWVRPFCLAYFHTLFRFDICSGILLECPHPLFLYLSYFVNAILPLG